MHVCDLGGVLAKQRYKTVMMQFIFILNIYTQKSKPEF